MAAGQADGGLAALSQDLASAVERAGRSVVAVHGRRRLSGSGIVWPGGAIVTADHVLEREEDLAVTTSEGNQLSATVVGRDPRSDLAVLGVDGGSLLAAQLAAADLLKVGHLVLALGRPFQAEIMASLGIVSALGGPWRGARGRTIEGFVRADITLYPGFSGGPLVDARGQVVGVNSSHFARGHGLAIPAQVAAAVVEALTTQGRVYRPYLGISSQAVQLPAAVREKLGLEAEAGLMVVWVEPGSPAEKGGVLMGDVLVTLAGRAVAGVDDLQAALGGDTIGKPLRALVVRAGDAKELAVVPGERT